jgi:hypothetical protein
LQEQRWLGVLYFGVPITGRATRWFIKCLWLISFHELSYGGRLRSSLWTIKGV